MNKLLFIIGLTSLLGSCKQPVEDQSEEEPFELRTILANEYKTLQLAEGIEAEIIDSALWPHQLIMIGNDLIYTSYPHNLSGNQKEITASSALKIGVISLDKTRRPSQFNFEGTEGYQTGIVKAPWGGLLIAAMPYRGGKRYTNGYIYWYHEGKTERLDALGTSCFIGLYATQTNEGKAVIYYADQNKNQSYLYKFVADSGTNLNSGQVYACQVHASNWIPLRISDNKFLADKFKSQNQLLNQLNEAAHLAGIQMVDPISDITFDPSNTNVVFAAMPQKEKNRLFGAIYQIGEEGGKFDGTYFHAEPLVFGGLHLNFTHTAFLQIDDVKNIWISSGIPSQDVGTDMYKVFGGNALLVMPRRGVQSRLMLRLAVAPGKERFSGICIDKKEKVIYSFLIAEDGHAKLLKIKGKPIEEFVK